MSDDTNNSSGLKMLTSFFAGIILTGLGAFIAYPKDLPTKADMASVQSSTNTQLAAIQLQANEEQTQITSLRIIVAKIAYKLNIPQETQ